MNRLFVNALAVFGGAVAVGVLLSPAASVSVYSPYLKDIDLYKIRGHELLGLFFTKDTGSKKEDGAPFPIGLRLRYFDMKSSLVEDIYKSATGKKLNVF